MIKGCGNGKLSIQLGNQSDKHRDRMGRTLIENKLNIEKIYACLEANVELKVHFLSLGKNGKGHKIFFFYSYIICDGFNFFSLDTLTITFLFYFNFILSTFTNFQLKWLDFFFLKNPKQKPKLFYWINNINSVKRSTIFI